MRSLSYLLFDNSERVIKNLRGGQRFVGFEKRALAAATWTHLVHHQEGGVVPGKPGEAAEAACLVLIQERGRKKVPKSGMWGEEEASRGVWERRGSSRLESGLSSPAGGPQALSCSLLPPLMEQIFLPLLFQDTPKLKSIINFGRVFSKW